MTFDSAQLTTQLGELFARRGHHPYGEAISQCQHALQCATLAERSGCDDNLVIAALLHDIGHLHEVPETAENHDSRHEQRAAELLRPLLPEAVWQPIRLHVAAKRYLCATDPAYHAALSPASRHSLALQGGPFAPREVAAFLRAPFARQALVLRRLDDLGKDPAMQTPPLEHFHPRLERLLRA
ncbi:phosphonate degradation HD-domain oxygenase [Pseudomonas benzenivorans]|uniref:phosphonate degradation HD-domain oxygenase n=1 Tax=Pseudomonas benzenivorans TaxID=556533 RepID=UPI00351956A4